MQIGNLTYGIQINTEILQKMIDDLWDQNDDKIAKWEYHEGYRDALKDAVEYLVDNHLEEINHDPNQ